MLFTLRGQKETAHTTTMNKNKNKNMNMNMNMSVWGRIPISSISKSKTLMTNSNRPKIAEGIENAEPTTAKVL